MPQRAQAPQLNWAHLESFKATLSERSRGQPQPQPPMPPAVSGTLGLVAPQHHALGQTGPTAQGQVRHSGQDFIPGTGRNILGPPRTEERQVEEHQAMSPGPPKKEVNISSERVNLSTTLGNHIGGPGIVQLMLSSMGSDATPSNRARMPMHKEFLDWWDDVVRQLHQEGPEDPFRFVADRVQRKLLENPDVELDEDKSLELFRCISCTAMETPLGLTAFEGLLVVLNCVGETPGANPFAEEQRARLEAELEEFDIMADSPLDLHEFLRFLRDAMAMQLVEVNGQQPHLMLNFDVNQTVIMLDSVRDVSVASCVNMVLSDHCWGNAVKTAAGEHWQLSRNGPSTERPELGLMSYSEFVDQENPMPEDRTDKDAVSEVRKRRRAFQAAFTEPGQPGERLRPMFKTMLNALMLPEGVRNTREAEAAGLEGESVLLLPCFINLLLELKQRHRSFSLIFRTYGLDLGKVQKELNALCEGRHPCYGGSVRLDGSDGQPDYRMALDSVEKSGTWYREVEADGNNGLIALIMGTVLQPSERPKKGDILGLPFYEALKAAKEREIEEKGELDSPIEMHLDRDAVMHYCSFCRPQTIALRDFYPSWFQARKKSVGGKPMFVDRSSLHKVLPIFFDDHIEQKDAKIVDCRSVHRYLQGFKGSINIGLAFGHYLVQAEPLKSITSPTYFLDKVKECESRHRALLERRRETGRKVQRLLHANMEELQQAVQKAMLLKRGMSTPMAGGREKARKKTGDRLHLAEDELGDDQEDLPEERLGAVKVIGLTSAFACGREEVKEILRQLGAIVIDCLKVQSEIIANGTPGFQAVQEFWKAHDVNIIGGDGEIDQCALRRCRPDLLQRYDKLVSTFLREAVHDKIRELDESCEMGMHYTDSPWMTRRVIVVEGSEILGNGLQYVVEELWTVTADVEVRVRNAVRTGIFTEEEPFERIKKLDAARTSGLKAAVEQVTIHNTGNMDEFHASVVEEWRQLHRRMHGVSDREEVVLEVVSPEDELIGAAPLSHVWRGNLWHRMVFVVLRDQKSGGFYATQRSMTKEYMPGRWDFAVFGKPTSAAVPAGGSPAQVAVQALLDKLGIVFPQEGLVEVTSFEYHGELSKQSGRVNFIGVVFEAFLDMPLSRISLDMSQVQQLAVLSVQECVMMQQSDLVPMTSMAHDAYKKFYMIADHDQQNPNLIATPGMMIITAMAPPGAEEEMLALWSSEAALAGSADDGSPAANFSRGIHLLGLSGEEQSSRSEAAQVLAELGAVVVDCERLSRQCLEKGTACFNEIAASFGSIVMGEDGELNSRLLMPLLGARPEMLSRFQDILLRHTVEAARRKVHRVHQEIRNAFDLTDGGRHVVRKVVVIDSSALREMGLKSVIDEEWAVLNNWDPLTRRRVLNPQARVATEEAARRVAVKAMVMADSPPALLAPVDAAAVSNETTVAASAGGDCSGGPPPPAQHPSPRPRPRPVPVPLLQVGEVSPGGRTSGSAPAADASAAGGRGQVVVEIKVSNQSRLREPVVEQWISLHQRMYRGVSDVNSPDNPIVAVPDDEGKVTGAAPLRWIREHGRLHKGVAIVLRQSAGGIFYCTRRPLSYEELPGHVDAALGRPQLQEIRAGETARSAAKRMLLAMLRLQAEPRVITEFLCRSMYITVLEVVIDSPVHQLSVNSELVGEVLALPLEVLLNSTELVPASAYIFFRYCSMVLDRPVATMI